MTAAEYQQRGTFAAEYYKEGCNEPVLTEIKLTGAPKRWSTEIELLSDDGKNVPNLLETTAYNLNTRTAAKLGKFYADPRYDEDQIISIVTAVWDPETFQQVLDDERSRIKKPDTKAKEIQIQNLPLIVQAMEDFYRQAPKDRVVHHRTTRARKQVSLVEYRAKVLASDPNAFVNITHLLSNKIQKATPKNPSYGDSHYTFVGMKSRFLISAKTPKEQVRDILSEALKRLKNEAEENEEARQLEELLREDINAVMAVNAQRVSPVPGLQRVSPAQRVSPSLRVSPTQELTSGPHSPVSTGVSSPPIDFRAPQQQQVPVPRVPVARPAPAGPAAAGPSTSRQQPRAPVRTTVRKIGGPGGIPTIH